MALQRRLLLRHRRRHPRGRRIRRVQRRLTAPARGNSRSGVRWTIVALLFAATTINYVDRQVLGILAPTLGRDLHWSETDYGAIVSWFSFAYGFGLLVMGRVLDWIGT